MSKKEILGDELPMWTWRSTYGRSLWDTEGGRRWRKINRKERQPLFKVLLPPTHTSALEPGSFRKPLPWCRGQSPKGKRVRDSSCCLSPEHRVRSVYQNWRPHGNRIGSHCYCSHHLTSHWEPTWGPGAKNTALQLDLQKLGSQGH